MSTDRPPAGTRGFDRFTDGRPVGDVIPFHDNGIHHLFVLTPPEDAIHFPERLRTTWRHLSSTDLVAWEQQPDAVAPDPHSEFDSGGIWTGSVMKADGTYHLFYTGHEIERQTICHAMSSDGVTWHKNPANPISRPDPARFESKDWRDPFVFFNEEEGVYWMLITSRLTGVPAAVRGVIALSTSPDLVTWSAPVIYYRTFMTHAPECPEVFRLDGRWVLGYSRFTDRRGTVYRVADSPRDPWRAFGDDGPDGPGWYAAKGLSDGDGRRIAFGWIPDHDPTPGATASSWLWGGDLGLPRQLGVRKDGVVTMRPPQEVLDHFGADIAFAETEVAGEWAHDGEAITIDAAGEVGILLLEALEPQHRSVLSVEFDGLSDAAEIGIVLNTHPMLDRGVGVYLAPRTGSLRLQDMTAPPGESPGDYETMADQYAPIASHEFGRPITEPITVTAVVRGDAIEVFVGDEACLTHRASTSGLTHVALTCVDARSTIRGLRWRSFE